MMPTDWDLTFSRRRAAYGCKGPGCTFSARSWAAARDHRDRTGHSRFYIQEEAA